MNDNGLLSYLRIAIKNINMLIILLISLLITYTSYKIVNNMQSRDFFTSIEMLPMSPWKVPVISLSCFLILILMMNMKDKEGWNKSILAIYSITEVVLSLVIMRVLNMEYNGILLLVISDLLISFKNSKLKIGIIGIIVGIYVLTNIDILPGQSKWATFGLYLEYYEIGTRKFIFDMKSLFISGNNFLFMVYMIALIRVQVIENERISLLNEKLDEANDKLLDSYVQLKEYAVTREKMAETRERNRLAREIHDTLGHTLTGIIAGIDASVILISVSLTDTKKQLNTIGNLARQGIKDVRRSVNALRPDALERLSLLDALKQMVTEINEISNAYIYIDNRTNLSKLNEDEEEAIYRICQEGTTNSIRHGKASIIRIIFEKELNILHITISDNGSGCANIKKGFGLCHMTERIEMLNGSLEYKDENGFVIQAKIPIRWGE